MRKNLTSWKTPAVITILLALLNLYIFINRQKGYGYRNFVSYPELYAAKEGKWIKSLIFHYDTAIVQLEGVSKDAKTYFLADTGKVVHAEWNGKKLKLPLMQGLHKYEWVIETPGSPENIRFEFNLVNIVPVPRQDALNEINYSSVFFPERTPYSVTAWSMQGGLLNDARKKEAGLKRLRQEIPGYDTLTASQRVDSVAALIYGLNGEKGLPPVNIKPEYLHWPDSLFVEVSDAQKYRLSCGDLSFLAAWLLVSSGIHVRSVNFKDGHANWSHPVHYFLEVFDAKRGSWYVFDPLNALVRPQKENGEYLNAVLLQQAFQLDPSMPGMVALYTGRDSIAWRPLAFWQEQLAPYYRYENNPLSYNRIHNGLAPTLFSRAWDFYTLPNTEMVYSTWKRNNWGKISLKLAAFYSFWMFLIITLIRIRRYRKALKN